MKSGGTMINKKMMYLITLMIVITLPLFAQRSLRIISPNGGENWTVGDCDTIRWTWTGAVTRVKIDYSTNLGGTWTIIDAATTCDSLYAWNVPNTPSNQVLVKITDADSTPVTDVSDNSFNLNSIINVTYPVGGESLATGSRANITWHGSKGIAKVKIEYSTNGGSSWQQIIAQTQNDSVFPWNVPNTPSNQCRIRVTDVDVAGTNAMSPSNFTIAARITVVSPNGGENFTVGSNQNITWTSPAGVSLVKIEYSTNSGSTWVIITSSAPNNGIYVWEVPNTPSGQCRVKVTDFNNSITTDMSDSDFNISSGITVNSPNGGEQLRVGFIHFINWNAPSGISKVSLNYSTNNGSTWILIANSWANRGFYAWNIPNTPSTECLVRIADLDNSSTIYDISDSVFTITLTLIEEVNSPVVPLRYYQSQNSPNPLHRQAMIKFSIPVKGRVSLKVYNAVGEKVRTLIDEVKRPDSYTVNWDGRDDRGIDLPGGVYFYQLQAGDFVDTKKAVILR